MKNNMTRSGMRLRRADEGARAPTPPPAGKSDQSRAAQDGVEKQQQVPQHEEQPQHGVKEREQLKAAILNELVPPRYGADGEGQRYILAKELVSIFESETYEL